MLPALTPNWIPALLRNRQEEMEGGSTVVCSTSQSSLSIKYSQELKEIESISHWYDIYWQPVKLYACICVAVLVRREHRA